MISRAYSRARSNQDALCIGLTDRWGRIHSADVDIKHGTQYSSARIVTSVSNYLIMDVKVTKNN